MSKRKKKTVAKKVIPSPEKTTANLQYNHLYPWIVAVMAFLLYINTVTHEYTQDDAIVIYDNMYTQQGISGIPGLLSKDTFYGFFKTEGKAKLVSGGRYRPLTPIMFAVEYQIFGKNPTVGHFVNIMLYALLCLLIYKMLVLLFLPRFGEKEGFYVFVLLASLLFAAHPIHTEAVANIKGRDEIMSMMGAVLALYCTLKYIDTSKSIYLIVSFIAFFLGLMSKETTITYLAVIPLSAYFFRQQQWKKVVKPFIAIFCATIVFLIIRTSILGIDMGGTPMELMNNPYLKIEGGRYVPFSGMEKMATIIYTLGKYIGLLVLPHPLTHDYYPRYIDMMTFGNWKVLVSLALYIGLAIFAFIGFKKKSVLSFSILYFIITLSIVSNIVFPIGTNMSERFLFMPSLGFAIGIAFIVYKLLSGSKNKMMYLLVPIMLLYGFKTITRNNVWESDFRLFTTDVKTSTNSAKVLNAAGGALVTESGKVEDPQKKREMLNEAIPYLEKALEIHPTYKNAGLLLGNAHYYNESYDDAIKAYQRTLTIAPDYDEVSNNLAVALRDGGRYAGEKEGNIEKAKRYLLQSLQLKNDDIETVRLAGITFGMSGDHQKAIEYFERVTQLAPSNAGGFVNLGKAYQNYGDEENARIMFQKAIQIDPKALENR